MAVAERFVDALLKNIVLLICLLPLVGAALTLLSVRLGAAHVRSTAVTNAVLTLLLSLLMAANYDHAAGTDDGRSRDMQMTSVFRWIGPFDVETPAAAPPTGGPNRTGVIASRGTARLSRIDIRFAVGVDGISLWPIVLTSLLSVVAIAAAGNVEYKHPSLLYVLLLIQQSLASCLFAASDAVLFCVCLQFVLVPMYFLIGGWGGYERRSLARRFLLLNMGGSLLVTIGLMSVAVIHADVAPPLTFSIPRLMHEFPKVVGTVGASDWSSVGPWILFALVAGFAVRLPVVPCHTWFTPTTVHTALPTGLLLVGLFPLIALYGLTRFVAPLLQASNLQLATALQAAAIGGVIYFGLLAYAAQNLGRLAGFACLSASHLAAAGVLSLTQTGTTGGLLYACGTALSLCAFLLAFGRGEGNQLPPKFAACRSMCALALWGVPGFAGFAGALLTLMGLFTVNRPAAVGGMLGWLLVACAVIRSTGGDRQGNASWDRAGAQPTAIFGGGKPAVLILLIAIIVWIGLYPQCFTSRIEPSVIRMLNVTSDR